MERSDIKRLKKRGLTNCAIADLVGHDRETVSRVLLEPTDQAPASRSRRSQVDVFTAQIRDWLCAGLPVRRMLELAMTYPVHPYGGGKSAFYERVRKIRTEFDLQKADVPIRFEGLPGEFLQVDWGEVRHFPLEKGPCVTRYFYAARLKYSRFMHVLWRDNMTQETLIRCLCATFVHIGGVPWVCVFDNLKTVTTGRDAHHQPIWHPVFFSFATDLGFTPQACDIRAANQKGSVENLVKFVKSNFLPGRSFFDEADLASQGELWLDKVNTRASQATCKRPVDLLPADKAALSSLPDEAKDYGLLSLSKVDRQSLAPAGGSRYSVPVAHAGAYVSVRLHEKRVRIYKDDALLSEHERRLGEPGRVIDPAHFEEVLAGKPQARVFLYRDALLSLCETVALYIKELVRRRYDQQANEILAVYALYQRYGQKAFTSAIESATSKGVYGAEYLQALLEPTGDESPVFPSVKVAFLPGQAEVDRALAAYEAHVKRVPGGK
ncbi:MAG: IS21 family transposase [Nitrospinaceae bacterium]|nr:IS21 family transposase [Nitrospinaceae bacterium]